MKTIIEPFRTKVVEAIRFTNRAERQSLLERAHYNLFQLRAEDTIIDLLTDSGTSAMSSEQWSALMKADESYAGCSSFYRFEKSVQDITGLPIVIPVHQGRAAERLLFEELLKKGDIVPSNTHFDTTRANIEKLSARALDLPCEENSDPGSEFPFKGNIDLEALSKLLEAESEKIPFIMLTVTNNAAGGQPVSMENLIGLSKIAKRYKKKLFLDAARFAENAYLIKRREPGMSDRQVSSIVKQLFAFCDGCLVSAKKDGLSNMGGFLALRDEVLASRLKASLVISEGFPTYGGLAGRDLETVSQGLREVIDEDYLQYRLASASYLANGLLANDIPIVTPPGMHAIYLDARRFFPDISPEQMPGQALVCELYLEGGIRSCEIGTLMFSKTRKDGLQEPGRQDLVRLALPRRVYSQSHYDYVIEAVCLVFARRDEISGLRIDWEPEQLRHFSARMSKLPRLSKKSEKANKGKLACP